MHRDQAEAEAERRNREDPKATRFEFYALDESAGLADDAWDVGMRLRPGASSAPATYAGARRRPDPPPPYEGAVAVPELYSEPPIESWLADEALPSAPAGRPRSIALQPSLLGRWLRRRREARETAEPGDEPRRGGLFIRGLGAAVVVVGMLWMGMVVALAVLLRPDDVTGVALYLGAAVLGLLAILLGVAIRRS
jgi:hypothetical protein